MTLELEETRNRNWLSQKRIAVSVNSYDDLGYINLVLSDQSVISVLSCLLIFAFQFCWDLREKSNNYTRQNCKEGENVVSK